ncbi:hypothetical protein E2C01_027601 [Portunus trituberculatus]|uniref:Uncharacterized protein n=1 Tax=Portunus trituberculatus TaxID=210409 RepID=A0A5B7ELL1_PORTR|nr:hypothetical protein [Portunus trituberculatus]
MRTRKRLTRQYSRSSRISHDSGKQRRGGDGGGAWWRARGTCGSIASETGRLEREMRERKGGGRGAREGG